MKKLLSILIMVMILLGTVSTLAISYASTYVHLTGSENVRTGPGLEYSSIGSAHKGSTLPYLGTTSVPDSRGYVWYLVSFSNTTGWVSSRYANLTSSSGSTYYGSGYSGGSSGGYSGGGSYVTATGNVNVRTGPGLDYADVGTLHTGETAPFLGATAYDSRGVLFYQISYGGQARWVSSIYTNLTGGGGGGYYGSYVRATGNVNVHTGPGLDYADVGTLHTGETVPFLGATAYDSRGVLFYQISYGGQARWVSSVYTTLY